MSFLNVKTTNIVFICLISLIALIASQNAGSSGVSGLHSKPSNSTYADIGKKRFSDEGDKIKKKIEALDSKDPFSNTNHPCSIKFQNIMVNLPSSIQVSIMGTFLKNNNRKRCCDPKTFIASIFPAFEDYNEKFAKIVTDSSQLGKKALKFFTVLQNLMKSQGMPPTPSLKTLDEKFVEDLLLKNNKLNHLLLKCINTLDTVILRNLALFCTDINLHKEIFEMNQFSEITNFKTHKKNNDLIGKDCSSYIQKLYEYDSAINDSVIDTVDAILGLSTCNYYNNFFSFDVLKDNKDPLYPEQVKKTGK